MSADDWAELFAIDADAHLAEADDAERFFDTLGPQVPDAVRAQLERAAAAAALRIGHPLDQSRGRIAQKSLVTRVRLTALPGIGLDRLTLLVWFSDAGLFI